MTPVEREAAILENVRSALIAEGYDVVVQPDRLMLPSFIQHLRPDAIAQRPGNNLVVEVVSRSPASAERLKRYRAALEGHPDWQLRTIWTSGNSVPRSLEKPSLVFVKDSLAEIDHLLDAGFHRPALLVAWACLEGVGRILLPRALEKPQTPSRLVEQLAHNGFLSREEAAQLRRLVSLRNEFVHGVLHTAITEHELVEFRDVLWKLHDIAQQQELPVV